MVRQSLQAIAACAISFVLCAVVYPLVAWGVAQAAFPDQAAGSLVYGPDRSIIGSKLIAQSFTSDRYFSPRPSAVNHAANAAGGSNLGTKNPVLRSQITERLASLHASAERPAPVDLVTTSGSGLDPHLSAEAAYFQAPRVANARNLPLERVRSLIESHVERSGAFLGATPRVNVLRLNLALDALN